MHLKLDCAQRAQTCARAKIYFFSEPKVIRDSNSDFRINPDADPDVCRIAQLALEIVLPVFDTNNGGSD